MKRKKKKKKKMEEENGGGKESPFFLLDKLKGIIIMIHFTSFIFISSRSFIH